MKYRYLALSLLALTVACSSHTPTPKPRPSHGASPQARGAVVATRRPVVRTKTSPAVRTKAGHAGRRMRQGRAAVDPAAVARAVLAEVNVARRRAGARPLRTDPALARAATLYARELASRREIEHVSRTPGRRTFRQRIAAAGGQARIAGENLARLTASSSSLPERAVNAWMRSPGHRANMLDASYARTGIGVWLGRDGIWYVVQEFATAD